MSTDQRALHISPPPGRTDMSAAVFAALERLTSTLKEWSARARQRRELAELSDYALRDIGLSRAEVIVETSKPIWR